MFKNESVSDFPGGPVVKNPPANAGEGHRFDSLSGTIPHALGQLSQHTTTTEPVCPGVRALQ